jgi:hypothetical protein
LKNASSSDFGDFEFSGLEGGESLSPPAEPELILATAAFAPPLVSNSFKMSRADGVMMASAGMLLTP